MLTVAAVHAVPARPGLWKTITTVDGTQMQVQLCGDERCCFWLSADGRRFVEDAQGRYVEGVQRSAAMLQRQVPRSLRQRRSERRVGSQPVGDFTGKRKGLIILAEFQNKAFAAAHDRAFFERVANERGFCEGSFKGSVKDYFLDQSSGLFELDFDVVGPVKVSRDYEYYGQPGTTDIDAHPWEMVVEACDLVADSVDFATYDWNGDGYCEQVFVLYAGQGQSDSYDRNTIWPHEYELSQVQENGVHIYGQGHLVGGCYVDTYACSNELTSQNTSSGIGTICHEFSHCMGLPDLYDVDYNGYFGMGHWDLMANGVYNGAAFVPAGYTSYERMVCGWLSPVELSADTQVSDMKPLSEGGRAYIIYNNAWPDEYYLLENRQPSGWDAALPGKGMLVLHVDYDERVWRENVVNSVCDYRSVRGMEDVWNTHQRLTLIHADNENDKRFWKSSYQSYTQTTEETDPYPSNGNDSLTNNSIPAALVYNGNTDHSLFMNRGIQAITQQPDGSMSFRFEAISVKHVAVDTTLTDKPDIEGAIFYESFDRCAGTGGNDGVFKGSSTVASAEFLPDNGGWDSVVMGGGARCAKFGNAGNDGIVSMPAIMLDGDSLELSFKAAPWSRDDTSLKLSVNGDAQLLQTDFEMAEGQWTTFATRLTGTGRVVVTFTPGHRFFLDEVVVRKPSTLSVGSALTVQSAVIQPVYNLQGQAVSAAKDRANRGGVFLVRQADGTVRKLFAK